MDNLKLNIRATSLEEQENIDKVVDIMKRIDTTTIVAGTIMPDACPTGPNSIPVGAVVVARNAIHPQWHSADVCCSVMLSDLGKVSPKEVLDAAYNVTHFGAGGRDFMELLLKNFPETGMETLISLEGSDRIEELLPKLLKNKFIGQEGKQKAISYLGTQGDGNHFLSVGVSAKTGDTMLVTHHGSRALGAMLYKNGLNRAKELTQEENAWIPYDTEDGRQYWEALQLVREWTKLNHEIIHGITANALGLKTVICQFWNEHNFVFKDGDLFYHAKGATPLTDKFVPDNETGLRIIPMNMAQPILIVKGKATDTNLGFAPHGAGRNVSRSKYTKQWEERRKQYSSEELMAVETAGLDIRWYSGIPDVSELPSAYKDANTVKEQMLEFGLGDIVDEIIPYGCIMAGLSEWKRRK